MSVKTDAIIKEVADKFIAMLEDCKGKGRWIKPFFTMEQAPYNFQSKRCYNGLNSFILMLISQERGYTSPKWGTFEQWKKTGRYVDKGQKATRVIFWNRVYKDKKAEDTTETDTTDETEDKKESVLIAREYYVFNECQLKDYVEPEPQAKAELDKNILEEIDNFRRDYLDHLPITISEGHGRACYIPSLDVIQLPSVNQFNPEMLGEFIPTACHETVHWSGAKGRLNRDLSGRFGSESYAFEELVADIGAGFISQHFGREYMFSDNNLKYIEGWVKILQDKPKAILTACSLAQKAADFLLSFTKSDDEEDVA